MKKTILLWALAATSLLATPAMATTFVLNLKGTVSDGTFNSFSFGGNTYHTWFLPLNGISPFNLNPGDEIQANITLDQSFTVPASGQMFIGVNFQQNPGDVQSITTPITNGNMKFFNSGPTGLVSNTVPVGCGNCIAGITFLGNHGPVSFNSVFTDITVSAVDPNFLINGASISYQLSDPFIQAVPEPAAWALMAVGFGLVGGAIRRRERVQVSFA